MLIKQIMASPHWKSADAEADRQGRLLKYTKQEYTNCVVALKRTNSHRELLRELLHSLDAKTPLIWLVQVCNWDHGGLEEWRVACKTQRKMILLRLFLCCFLNCPFPWEQFSSVMYQFISSWSIADLTLVHQKAMVVAALAAGFGLCVGLGSSGLCWPLRDGWVGRGYRWVRGTVGQGCGPSCNDIRKESVWSTGSG